MRYVFALMALTGLSLAEANANDEVRPVRVLVVTGVDYQGHHWKLTAPAVRDVLQAEGGMEARVIDDHEFLASDVIFDYDVILLHFKNYDPTKRAEQVQANLTKFVRQGGGLVLYHFACGAFEQWPEFEQLAGRVWDKKKRGHDPRGPFTVNIADKDHPITRGLEDFETDDELYTCLGGERPIHVVATATSKVDGQVYPMAFVLDYGDGRVFHTVLGHDVRAVTLPGPAELLRRGCLWAAGREP
jgi:type 1 glutamine amidotransferase